MILKTLNALKLVFTKTKKLRKFSFQDELVMRELRKGFIIGTFRLLKRGLKSAKFS